MKRHLGLLAAACVLASIPCSRARADERYDGLQAHASGNWKEAYARLKSVHRTHPDESEVALKVYESAFNLLQLLRLEKRPAEGLEVVRFLESMDRRYLNNDHPGRIAIARARVMLDLGRADEAIESYQRARDALPGLPGLTALGELALAHEAIRNWHSVIAVLQQYGSRNGTMTPELLTLRARAEERSGAVHQAATSIQTALSARPDDAGLKVLQTTVGRQWTPAATIKARRDEFFTLEFCIEQKFYWSGEPGRPCSKASASSRAGRSGS
jgi:tetratricopeptide (TPR) repeat protein